MRRLVLVHGYSASAKAFTAWRRLLANAGWPRDRLVVVSYASLADEVTLADIAEGFDLALRDAGLADDEPFDCIVHSTGMLVLRAWLAFRPGARLRRLKHLVALAPATNGSPQAHKGRSFLGALVKGNRTLGPDFMETGREVLDALELGSRITWQLAHRDLFGERPFYTDRADGPYVFLLCGAEGYSGIASVVSEAGSDGTVRWAGCPLNARKVTIDLSDAAAERAISVHMGTQADVPLMLVPGLDHGTILTKPTAELADAVLRALRVEDEDGFHEWLVLCEAVFGRVRNERARWQQFVVRCTDERGDPVYDWNLQLFRSDGSRLESFAQKVHVYDRDASYRCFHVDLAALGDPHEHDTPTAHYRVQLIASTNSERVTYAGADFARQPAVMRRGLRGQLDVELVLPAFPRPGFSLFHPCTTTFVELRIDREALLGNGKVIVVER